MRGEIPWLFPHLKESFFSLTIPWPVATIRGKIKSEWHASIKRAILTALLFLSLKFRLYHSLITTILSLGEEHSIDSLIKFEYNASCYLLKERALWEFRAYSLAKAVRDFFLVFFFNWKWNFGTGKSANGNGRTQQTFVNMPG